MLAKGFIFLMTMHAIIQLQNSMEQKLPVRVIRGHDSKSSYVGRVYTYDGLYEVTIMHFIIWKCLVIWLDEFELYFIIFRFALDHLKSILRNPITFYL